MSKILAGLTSPQFRQWLYGIITVVGPILVVYGIVNADQLLLWLALAGQVLATGTATVAVAKQRAAGVLPVDKPAPEPNPGQ